MIRAETFSGTRYLINNPLFVGLVIRQLLRRWPAESASWRSLEVTAMRASASSKQGRKVTLFV